MYTLLAKDKELASSRSLLGLREAVEALKSDNLLITGPGGKTIATSRDSYFQLRSVLRETRKQDREEYLSWR